jgi:hypothetical protein
MVRRWHADPFGFLRPWNEVPALFGSAPPTMPPSTGTGRGHLPDGVASNAGMIDWIKTVQGSPRSSPPSSRRWSPGGTSACRASCSRPSWRRFTAGSRLLEPFDQGHPAPGARPDLVECQPARHALAGDGCGVCDVRRRKRRAVGGDPAAGGQRVADPSQQRHPGHPADGIWEMLDSRSVLHALVVGAAAVRASAANCFGLIGARRGHQ